MTLKEYNQLYKEATKAPGREAIDNHLQKTYPNMNFRHYPVANEGETNFSDSQALEGVSIFDVDSPQKHRHLVSYGLSELYYNPKAYGQDFSKWGFELSFRLTPYEHDEDDKNTTFGDPVWAVDVLHNLAKFVYETKQWFVPKQFLPANGPIRMDTDTDLTGFIFVEDPVLKTIKTLHGDVQFIQVVGITEKELQMLIAQPNMENMEDFILKLSKENPLLITDLNRKSLAL